MSIANQTNTSDIMYNLDTKQEIDMIEVEKPSVQHQENASADADQDMHGQELTGFEGLTLFQTLKMFKKTSLLCLAVTFTACAEGYEVRQSAAAFYEVV